MRVERISERAAAYGMYGVTVDGNDPQAVFAAVQRARQQAVAGHGPTLIECNTYRYMGHSKSDRQAYRTREEVKAWMDKDPIERLAGNLGLKESAKEALFKKAEAEIAEAVSFAEASPEPDPADIMEGVYA
jgi:pyruvate dehydrogenase E1 component alpha subunit